MLYVHCIVSFQLVILASVNSFQTTYDFDVFSKQYCRSDSACSRRERTGLQDETTTLQSITRAGMLDAVKDSLVNQSGEMLFIPNELSPEVLFESYFGDPKNIGRPQSYHLEMPLREVSKANAQTATNPFQFRHGEKFKDHLRHLHFSLTRAIELEDYLAARYIFGDLLNLIQSLYSRQHRRRRETEQMSDAASEVLGIRLPRSATGTTGYKTAMEATRIVSNEICRRTGSGCGSFQYDSFTNVLVVLIDTTGSMHDDIDQAKTITLKLAQISTQIWSKVPKDLREKLVPFGFDDTKYFRFVAGGYTDQDHPQDTKDLTPRLEVCDSTDCMRTFLSGLHAQGGGNCPERPLEAILSLILKYGNEVGSAAPVYLITDASSRAEDQKYREMVKSLVSSKQLRLNFITTGNLCGDGPDFYQSLAEETGGLVHDLQKASLSDLTDLIHYQTRSRSTVKTALLKPFSARRRRQAQSSQNTEIKVDSTMTILLIILSGKQGSLQVRHPNGTVYSSDSINFLSNLENVKAAKFDQRDFLKGWNGTWTATSSCRGKCNVAVETETPIDFTYKLVSIWKRLGKRVADYAPTLSTPMEGQIEHVILTAESSELIDPNVQVMVELIGSGGTSFQSIQPERGQGRSSNIFAMTFTTPSQPFQFHIRGMNIYGELFERTIAEVITPLHFRLELILVSDASTITPGKTAYIHMALSNKGPGDRFKINVLKSDVFTAVLSTEECYVATNQKQFFFVKVSINQSYSQSEVIGHLYKVTMEAVSQNTTTKRSAILSVDMVVVSGTSYVTVCQHDTCHNGGTCIEQGDAVTYKCACPTGFTGMACEDPIGCVENLPWTLTEGGFMQSKIAGNSKSTIFKADLKTIRLVNATSAVGHTAWKVSKGGFSLKLNFETSHNCGGHNSDRQVATATTEFTLSKSATLTVNWIGRGETEADDYETMDMFIDGSSAAKAQSQENSKNSRCSTIPVISDPAPPVRVQMNPGRHAINITLDTVDGSYNKQAFYQFWFRFSCN